MMLPVQPRAHHRIEYFRVAVAENARFRDFYVLENDEGVLFVESTGKRLIETVSVDAVVVATQNLEPRCGERHRERQGDLRLIERHRMGRVDRQFVGERAQRGKNARTADDDRVGRLVDLAQRQVLVHAFVVRHPLVDDRVDDRMRQGQVLGRDLLLERHQIGVPGFVAGDPPQARLARETGKGHIHIVRRSTKHADAVPGDLSKS